MAKDLAIAAVSMAICRLLTSTLKQKDLPATPVAKMYATKLFEDPPVDTPTVSIYLYRIAANTNRRNLPPRFTAEGGRLRPALPVDLYYLLSVWAASAESEQQLLGQVLCTLNDMPMLSASFINDGPMSPYKETFRNDEAVELVYDPLSLTDMINLWELLKPAGHLSLQPSGTFVARAVAIESETEIFLGEPVVQRQFDYLKPLAETALAGTTP